MRDIFKNKTFRKSFIFSFASHIYITFKFVALFREILYLFFNIRISSEYKYVYVLDVFTNMLINAILCSVLCLLEKEKVQWILGIIIGSVLSAVLVTLIYIYRYS